MTANVRRSVPMRRRVVGNADSSSLVDDQGGLNVSALERRVDHVTRMWERGYPSLLVSSGAVAAGLSAPEPDRPRGCAQR